MKHLKAILSASVLLAAQFAGAGQIVVVNEYFGMQYRKEPVSFDVPARGEVRLMDSPTQVERLDADTVRIWTTVDFQQPGQMLFTVQDGKPDTVEACSVADAGEAGGVRLALVTNGIGFAAKVPVGSVKFAAPRSAFDIPGPVASLSRDGGATWFGCGYLDTIRRVTSVECAVTNGAVFFESRITYRFEDDRTYVARVRVFEAKPYAQLVEDFNVGGTAKFVFNYDDWAPPYFLSCTDAAQVKTFKVGETDAGDFVREPGQTCLVRMVIWSQFGYFGPGMSETIGLMNENADLAVGAFYMRPDRWTRAKVNHVDLYIRPEVPGDRSTRGVAGLAGARNRIAMEAWLIDGHREWALFAMPAGTWKETPAKEPPPQGSGAAAVGVKKEFQWNAALRKAHVVEGVWPLDRINRLQLVWNADGSPVSPENSAPMGAIGFGGDIATVLKSTSGRGGLQHFNGSNPSMRGGFARSSAPVLAWARANPAQRSAAALQQTGKIGELMVGPAMAALMAMDDSAYPGPRAMLPWSNPEAINPFYQGMENMNFNTDRYESILAVGEALEAMGCPWASNVLAYVAGQYRGQLDRYVYPQSGCWEESHTYAGCILRATLGTGMRLKEPYLGDVFKDTLAQKAFNFWTMVLSPRDSDFAGKRHVPPIGDHGGPTIGSNQRLEAAVPQFAAAGTPDSLMTAAELTWGLAERGWTASSNAPAASKPEWRSRWLQGYGSVLRATAKDERESMIIVRAGQSWGHHHMDKGSLWGWFRDTHFFGDAAWGSPPGGTYWNPYKQGPAGHTTIEFVGINNWPLPCKYPAPWIADESYESEFDYCLARCLYPYNPELSLTNSSPVAMINGFDRQVLFVHPDIMVVRDNIETTVPTIWRMHSLQFAGTTVEPGGALLAATNGVHGRLRMVYPDNVRFTTTAVHDLPTEDGRGKIPNEPFGSPPAAKKPYDSRTLVLRWDMPLNTSATWVFSVQEKDAKPVKIERLDDAGRVARLTTAEGLVITAFLNSETFRWQGQGLDFEGTAGLVIGKKVHPIRCAKLTLN